MAPGRRRPSVPQRGRPTHRTAASHPWGNGAHRVDVSRPQRTSRGLCSPKLSPGPRYVCSLPPAPRGRGNRAQCYPSFIHHRRTGDSPSLTAPPQQTASFASITHCVHVCVPFAFFFLFTPFLAGLGLVFFLFFFFSPPSPNTEAHGTAAPRRDGSPVPRSHPKHPPPRRGGREPMGVRSLPARPRPRPPRGPGSTGAAARPERGWRRRRRVSTAEGPWP